MKIKVKDINKEIDNIFRKRMGFFRIFPKWLLRKIAIFEYENNYDSNGNLKRARLYRFGKTIEDIKLKYEGDRNFNLY